MNAIDYFKKYGLAESKKHLDWMAEVGARMDVHGGFMNDLKRLVESHELVKKFGGLYNSKGLVGHFKFIDCSHMVPDGLEQAIADVESCQ